MHFSVSDIKKSEDKEIKLNLASLTGLNGTFCIFNLDVNIFLNVMSWIKRKSLRTTYAGVFVWLPGAPLTYFNDRGVRRILWGLTFWPKGIFLGLWKMPRFFWVAKTTEGFFWVLYFSSAQIKNNISAIYSFVFDQNQSWSWHVLAFQKINNKICWCKNTEGFFWVC